MVHTPERVTASLGMGRLTRELRSPAYGSSMPKYQLTGFSAGNAVISGGVQWQVLASDRDLVIQLIDELEDRRLLWETTTRERSDHCAASASYVRTYLSTLLKSPGLGQDLKREIKIMRRHFSTFMSDLSDAGLDHAGPVDSLALERVLGWLRVAVGEQVGLLAAQYGVVIAPELASIVPGENDWFFEATS